MFLSINELLKNMRYDLYANWPLFNEDMYFVRDEK